MNGLPPYAAMLGLELFSDMPLTLVMPFTEHLVGAPGRLHGGALAGMMEIAGLMTLRQSLGEVQALIKPVTVTVDFMREGALRETYAAAELARLGRRVANLRVSAWQEHREKPVATAQLNVMIERR